VFPGWPQHQRAPRQALAGRGGGADPSGDGSLSAPRALQTECRPFARLTDADLGDEHDPDCRCVAGLLSVLQSLYPGFSADEDVTLVHFSLEP
jgi:hypothetical protein